MKIFQNNCPACGSAKTRDLIREENFPAILFPIEHHKRLDVSTSTIVVKGCFECNHIFLTEIDIDFNKKIYSDYYYLYPYGDLESMNENYRRPFEQVFDLFSKTADAGKRLLEIGCSSSNQLDFFRKYGYVCKGISPGAQPTELSDLVDAYYEDVQFKNHFDCIVSRFNLEHIIDVASFLNKIHGELVDDGLFFVQVPNVESYLIGGIVNIFAHEHPQYFSKKSIIAAINRAGFQVEFIKADPCDPSIILVGRKYSDQFVGLGKIQENINVIGQILDVMSASPRDVDFIFYGAGLTLTGLLYLDRRLLQFQERITLIDDNAVLAGRYMPNTELKIEQLNQNMSGEDSILFILLNPIYHSRVLANVKHINFNGIYYLDGGGIHRLT